MCALATPLDVPSTQRPEYHVQLMFHPAQTMHQETSYTVRVRTPIPGGPIVVVMAAAATTGMTFMLASATLAESRIVMVCFI